MLKLLGGIAVVLSGLSLGLLKQEDFKRRERELLDFFMFLERIENEFSCLKAGLLEALERALPYCKTEICTLLSGMIDQLKTVSGMRTSDAWEDVLKRTKLSLSMEDMGVLRDFGKGLDGIDFSAQLKNIEFTKNRIQSQLKDAEKARKTNGKLAVQLSVLGSATAVLLLL